MKTGTPEQNPERLTLAEAATYLRVEPITLYRLLSCREIPAFKVGRDWCICRSWLEEWTWRQTVMPRKQS
jgi:excisionase family DNA binding protein